jgi:transposase-like protein
MSKSRFTFAEISRLTQTEDEAIAFAERRRWGGEVTCHRSASTDVARLGARPGRYRCRGCARQFSIRTGTPMESSRLPVSTWLRALWLLMSSSKEISSLRLGEMLGIQQKSAWLLAHRVRLMMAWVVRTPISGEVVELDRSTREPLRARKPAAVRPARSPALAQMGPFTYTRHLMALGSGNLAEQVCAWLLLPDRLTLALAQLLTLSLP